MRVNYKRHYNDDDVTRDGWDLTKYRKFLRTYLECLYFDNEDFFFIKLASLNLALKRICSGRWLYEIGGGGDGKSKEFILESGLLGNNNVGTLDIGALLKRDEWRKSGHLGWNKSQMRIQESAADPGGSMQLLGDIWKRLPEDETVDVRVNYGFYSTTLVYTSIHNIYNQSRPASALK